MTPEYKPSLALEELLTAMCDGELSAAQSRELESLVENDEDACWHYLCCIHLHGLLHWDCGKERRVLASQSRQHRTTPADPSMMFLGASRATDADASSLPIVAPPSTYGFLPGLTEGTFGYVSSGWPTAYLIATLVITLGIAIAAVTHVSQPEQVVQQPSIDSNRQSPSIRPALKASVVGRITGMMDCVWSTGSAPTNPKSEIHNLKSPVSLGDRFDIRSGLLEITYDTGAKVILQGPVTYEVEAAAGGYLAVGKLTARVEKKMAREASVIPHLFAVRTPTAVVTDLGTEFGVEVDAQGASRVETFVGLVEASPLVHGKSGNGRKVAAGEAVQIDRCGKIATAQLKPLQFMRTTQRKEPPYVEAVLTDRPVAYWRLADASGATWVADRSNHGYFGRVCGPLKFGQSGPLADPDSRSIEFNGHSYIELQNTPNFDPSKGFSVEVWAQCNDRPSAANDAFAAVAWRDELGSLDVAGFTLYVNPSNRWGLQSGSGIRGQSWERNELEGPTPVLGEWVHLVGVFQAMDAKAPNAPNGMMKLFINGRLVTEAARRFASNQRQPLRIGAGRTESSEAGSFFVGRLAEIALYDRPLAATCIRSHWEFGKSQSTSATSPQKATPTKD